MPVLACVDPMSFALSPSTPPLRGYARRERNGGRVDPADDRHGDASIGERALEELARHDTMTTGAERIRTSGGDEHRAAPP
jgi:hypothetical protein